MDSRVLRVQWQDKRRGNLKVVLNKSLQDSLELTPGTMIRFRDLEVVDRGEEHDRKDYGSIKAERLRRKDLFSSFED
jgi:hypothetical protein